MPSMTQINPAIQQELDDHAVVAHKHAVNAMTKKLEDMLDKKTDVSNYGGEPRLVLWTTSDTEEQLQRVVGTFKHRNVDAVNSLADNGCEMTRVTTLFEMDDMDEEHWMSFAVGTVTNKRTFGVFDTRVGQVQALTLQEIFLQYGEEMLLKIGRELFSPSVKSYD